MNKKVHFKCERGRGTGQWREEGNKYTKTNDNDNDDNNMNTGNGNANNDNNNKQQNKRKREGKELREEGRRGGLCYHY